MTTIVVVLALSCLAALVRHGGLTPVLHCLALMLLCGCWSVRAGIAYALFSIGIDTVALSADFTLGKYSGRDALLGWWELAGLAVIIWRDAK
jgi:hypothetical protein